MRANAMISMTTFVIAGLIISLVFGGRPENPDDGGLLMEIFNDKKCGDRHGYNEWHDTATWYRIGYCAPSGVNQSVIVILNSTSPSSSQAIMQLFSTPDCSGSPFDILMNDPVESSCTPWKDAPGPLNHLWYKMTDNVPVPPTPSDMLDKFGFLHELFANYSFANDPNCSPSTVFRASYRFSDHCWQTGSSGQPSSVETSCLYPGKIATGFWGDSNSCLFTAERQVVWEEGQCRLLRKGADPRVFYMAHC